MRVDRGLRRSLREGLYFVERVYYTFSARRLLKKPLLFARMFRVASTHALTRRNVVWDLALSITSQCNLNCDHCFARAFAKSHSSEGRTELSTQEMVAVVKEYLALGVVHFSFQGGEIFYRDDLEEIIKACAPHKSYVSIVTNGTLFTDSLAAKLRRWEVDHINISIDSGIPAEHDSFRSKQGTWALATSAVDRAIEHGFKVTVCTTVTHESLRSAGFRKINEYCREKKVIHWIFIGIPVGNWSGKEDVLITDEDRRFLQQLNRESSNTIHRDVDPHMFRHGCPAVKEGTYMSAYGDILPCPFIHISLGNVREHTVADIVRRAKEVRQFREHSPLCLIGEDKEFIAKYGRQTFTAESLPLDGRSVFGLSHDLPSRSTPLGDAKAR